MTNSIALGLKEAGCSGLWQVGKENYQVDSIEGNTIGVSGTSPSIEKSHWMPTLLKVAVLLPIIALIITRANRKNYTKAIIPSPVSLNPAVYEPFVEDVIAKIQQARRQGLKTAIYVGRGDTQSIPKEEGWYWVSLDHGMENALDENRPHLKMDFNAQMGCIANLFDKVVVDQWVLKFFHAAWDTLHHLMVIAPESELVVEADPCMHGLTPESMPDFQPGKPSYQTPVMDKVQFQQAEKVAFATWQQKVGIAQSDALYDEFKGAKSPAEIDRKLRMANGSEDRLKMEFMHMILKKENIEPKKKSYLPEFYEKCEEYLVKLFGEVTLHLGEKYPYQNNLTLDFWVLRNPKQI